MARRSVSVSRSADPGIRVELLFLLIQTGHPFHEGSGLPLVADLGILQLAGSQPFVLLSEPGGELGDGLAIGFGKLAAIQIGRDRRRGELGALGQPGERDSIVGRGGLPGGDVLQPRPGRVSEDRLPQG